MTDSSLWHRLNPFHPRPQSSLRKHSSIIEYEDRGSSVDTSVPQFSDDSDSRSKTVYTPASLFNPSSPSKHTRNPSILRSLAHHPSLSALRSRSKKVKKAKSRSPLPPFPGRESTEYDMSGSPVEYRDSPSPKKLRRKTSLKESKSMPQTMRTSGETTYPRSSADTDHYPPVPSPAPFVLDNINVTKVRPRKHRREESRVSIVKRKPVPSSTPDITIVGADVTPESVKVRRMRFQFDFSVDGSPPSMGSLASVSAARRRAMSTGEVDTSPSKPRAQTSRHLSSPAPPSPFRHQFASSHHPFTTQHPHPVPLTLSPRPTFDKTSSQYGDYDPEDFVPLTESGQSHHVVDEDDAFDLLVGKQKLPSGTPGGKKADLRRGALVDGAKHEKNAIRFFSRDMYEPSSSRSSPSASTPPIPLNVSQSSYLDARSESPFEVKLSPMVTKRMSLDAFGTSTPPLLSHVAAPSSDIEELAEEDEGASSEAELNIETGDEVHETPIKHHTTLSTIQEASSSCQDTSSSREYGQTSASLGVTQYYTPASSALDSRGIPRAFDSPFLPPNYRQHLSCPPLLISGALLSAQSEHTKALSHELKCAKDVIASLEEELAEMRVRAEKAEQVDEEEKQWLHKAKELEGLLAERDDEFDEINEQIETQAKEHGITVTQLRTALEENEGYFDTLQQAHDELADRLAELETEHAEVLIERKGDAETLQQAHDEVRELKHKVHRHEGDRGKVEAAIVELQGELHRAEAANAILQAELDRVNEIQADIDNRDQTQLSEMMEKLKIKEDRVLELEDLLRDGIERESEFTKLTNTLKAKDERIIDLQNRQTDRQRMLDSLKETIAEKDETIATLTYRVEELDGEKKRLDKEGVAALKSITAKDLIIGVLRDKLSTADYEKDELIAKNRFDEKKAEEKVQKFNDELQRQMGELESSIRAKESVHLELESLQQSNEALRLSAERSVREADEAVRGIQALAEEKAVWESERAELTIKLEDAEITGEEVESLQEQLDDRTAEVETLQIELEDLHESLNTNNATLSVQDQELAYLRQALVDAEDSAESLGDGFLRRARDAEREVESMRQQLNDLSADLQAKDEAVRQAVGREEMEKANGADVKSRLNAFTAEIDRLSLCNAELKKEIDDAKRGSSSIEIKLLDMGKTISNLEEDKELLNVALDSKQTELVLLQRQLGQGTPKPRPTSLAASTSRIARPILGMGEVTPVPKSLSKSVSHASLRHSRGGSITATPTPSGSGSMATPRARAVVTPSPMPLGTSMRHNRTPEKRAPVKKVVPVTQGGAAGTSGKPTLGRRSSPPVMRGTSMDLGKKRMSGIVGQLGEEDETERV